MVGHSRRALLAGAAASLSLAACGPPSDQTIDRESHLEPTDDAEILAGAISLVLAGLAAHELARPRLDRASRALSRRLAAQELVHRDALRRELAGLAPNATIPTPPGAPAPADRGQALALLVRSAERSVGYWVDALPKLGTGLRALPATVLASDAQHLTLWRGRLGLPAVPAALVLGEHP